MGTLMSENTSNAALRGMGFDQKNAHTARPQKASAVGADYLDGLRTGGNVVQVQGDLWQRIPPAPKVEWCLPARCIPMGKGTG